MITPRKPGYCATELFLIYRHIDRNENRCQRAAHLAENGGVDADDLAFNV